MKKSLLVILVVIATVTLLCTSFAQAAVITSGNVEPADPSTWDRYTNAYIGNTADGALTANGGSELEVSQTYVGNEAGVTGRVIFDGAGTYWRGRSSLRLGNAGTGYLSFTNGATGRGNCTIGAQEGSFGMLTIDGAGSQFNGNNEFIIGHEGTAVIKVTNGGSLISRRDPVIGQNALGNGHVIVDGPGSEMYCQYASYLGIGWMGTGALTVTNGGSVFSEGKVYIGRMAGGNGTAKVDGAGSTLEHHGYLHVGYSGTGNLSISNGGFVKPYDGVSINSTSLLTIDVGKGSSIDTTYFGTGTVTNNGTLRMVAGAAAPNGTYTPIIAGIWDGTGTLQALGGVWDPVNHTVTVSDAGLALAGRAKTIDLAATQRLLFIDAPTGRVAGASYMAADTPTDLTVTASLMGAGELSALESILGAGKQILAGWDFTVGGPGYADGDPVYLSFEIGDEYDLSVLALWYYDGSNWSEYFANDLTYDGVYASFTVTDFSGYAVTAAASVPVPAAVWLLGSGLAGLGFVRRKYTGKKASA